MIRGALVTLRPAEDSDRRAVYQWLAASDLTSSILGPPDFPDAHVPTWEEFCADYVSLFVDGSQPALGRSYVIERDGEAVGHVSYDRRHLPAGWAELDIWLAGGRFCGHGYGPAALETLVRRLHQTLGLTDFILRPSLRNARAIQAYAKAQFELLPLTIAQQAEIYGPGDYNDTVVMHRTVAHF
jgi:diamine N-acetyltransferase